MKQKIFRSIVVGILVGLISTYPIELGIVPSIVLWGMAGIVLGLFIEGKKDIIRSGILYGVFLSIFFLFSRFGGSADKILPYTLFVAGMSAVGAVGGLITVFIGSRLRQKKSNKQ